MKKMKSSRARLYLWGGILLALVLCMMFVGYLIPWDAYAQDLSMAQQPPSAMHLLGTDRYGRDMLARVLVGGRTSIWGALVVVLLITAIGAGIGTGSGWYGGRIEQAWMGLSDVFLAFPGMELAALSFLGLGVKPPIPEWGAMMSEGRRFLQLSPWMVMAPGAAMCLTVGLFHLLGEALRDAFDPRER